MVMIRASMGNLKTTNGNYKKEENRKKEENGVRTISEQEKLLDKLNNKFKVIAETVTVTRKWGKRNYPT